MIRSGSKNRIRGKGLHERPLSHRHKNIQGLHPKPKLPLNRHVLPRFGHWAATAQTNAESSDTSRAAQPSEQASPVNPTQPPRLRPRLRITSDLGRPLHEQYAESPSPPRNTPATLPRELPEPSATTNHGNTSIFGNQMGNTNHGVNPNTVPDSAFMRAARSSSAEAQPFAGNVAAVTQQTSPAEPPRGDDMIQ